MHVSSLRMTGIVALIERIYCYYFKSIYLKNERIFAISYCILRFYIKFLAISKKKLYSLRIPEFIDFKTRAYLKA